MYVAPLNYDRFFKKVFSDIVVAQAFLQDVLETPVEIIEKLERQNRVSDRATVVEFDFRCRIGGQNVIVEMQQCYKPSVVKRFYLYHSLQTVLQLEPLYDKAKRKKEQETKVEEIEKKRKLDLDYSNLDPVLTLIWMVQDRLGFEENFMPFILTPEPVREFLSSKFWDTTTNIVDLQTERKRLCGLLENDIKNMHFLAKNRLVFMFQKNIIIDIKKYSKNNENILINPTGFQRWFEFAELSLNKENTKDEFQKFQKDPVFSMVMSYLESTHLSEEDWKYISEEEKMIVNFELIEKDLRQEANRITEEKRKQWQQEGRQEGRQEGVREEKVKLLSKLLAQKLKSFPDVIEQMITLHKSELLDNLVENIFFINTIDDLKNKLNLPPK